MKRILLAVAAMALSASALALDHEHNAWGELLHKHVRYMENGNASRVDYAELAKDRAALKAVLDDYRKVTRAEFGTWTKPQQQAFLINDYNALTIEKILTRFLQFRLFALESLPKTRDIILAVRTGTLD